MDLTDCSVEELEDELKKKKKSHKEKPMPLNNPNFFAAKTLCINHISEIFEKGFGEKDFEHSLYEAVLEAVYGEDIWDWVNSNHEK